MLSSMRLGIRGVVRRALHHEFAFGLEAPAEVLDDADVVFRCGDSFCRVLGRWNAVRCSGKQNRKTFAHALGGQNDGFEMNAVAHGDHGLAEVEDHAIRRGLCNGRRSEDDEGNEPHTSSFGSLYLTTQVAKGGEREPADSLRSSAVRTPEAPGGHQIA